MSYFKAPEQPVDATYIRFDGQTEGKYGMQWNHIISVNNEEMTWSASKFQNSQIEQLTLREGDRITIYKTFSKGKAYTNIELAGDARSESAKREYGASHQQMAPPITPAPQSQDDTQKRITMGMCLNAASRFVSAAYVGNEEAWINEEVAKKMVSLGKAIYLEYTGDEDALPF